MAYKDYKDINKRSLYVRRKYRVRHANRRVRVLNMLGAKCVICNNSDLDVLTIDHVIPLDTGINRLTLTQLLPKILRGDCPTDNLQALCANCHLKKTRAERARV